MKVFGVQSMACSLLCDVVKTDQFIERTQKGDLTIDTKFSEHTIHNIHTPPIHYIYNVHKLLFSPVISMNSPGCERSGSPYREFVQSSTRRLSKKRKTKKESL